MAVRLEQLNSAPLGGTRDTTRKAGGMDWLNRDISFGGNRLNDAKKVAFYGELQLLFSAGIDLKTGLELIEEQQKKKADRELFASVRERVMQGDAFSSAIESTGKFTPYEYFSLRIGEESGRLPEILVELTTFFEKKIKQRRQVVSALSYPVIILLTAVGAIIFMLQVIVPMFEDVFKRFDGDLPPLTKMVIGLSESVGGSLGWAGLLVGGWITIAITQRTKPGYRRIATAVTGRIPLFGAIQKRVFLARFTQSMQLLTSAGTPLVDSLDLVRKMVGYFPIEQSLKTVRDRVVKGSALHEAMAPFSIFDRRMISLIKVAEEVNQLDLVFGKLAGQYQNEVEHRTGVISSVLEPILIIFIGLFVAIILIAMYLPLFKLGTAVG